MQGFTSHKASIKAWSVGVGIGIGIEKAGNPSPTHPYWVYAPPSLPRRLNLPSQSIEVAKVYIASSFTYSYTCPYPIPTQFVYVYVYRYAVNVNVSLAKVLTGRQPNIASCSRANTAE